MTVALGGFLLYGAFQFARDWWDARRTRPRPDDWQLPPGDEGGPDWRFHPPDRRG